ncbi:NAD-dependent epimerase/dehydratase family protein [Flavobacterium sp. W22_SRS_FP1]|uniref:NAD-dependent epimerase/dehydratase family protein n=1 Tax=Flavobacterium sp. W22_SRS_FP1 TaxID=3240276 RepID=UPI003F8DDE9B
MSKKIAIITGSGGLVGVESVRFFAQHFDLIIGIDNDSRGYFFGPAGSVSKNIESISNEIENYVHYPIDIRDKKRLNNLFIKYKTDIQLIINAAAQPSHDWSGRYPIEDFEINAVGALNVLEEMRNNCPAAVFIQLSSSKVYGDNMNTFNFIETDTRYELEENHKYFFGFTEDMAIDQSLHSPYGASKLASDIMCQEYARYYGLNVGIFRPNCITGGPHSGVELHGFLSYMVKCKTTYNVFGFKGKQVRDNIHARDLILAFFEYYKNPKAGEVYNIGGGRENSCSIIEALALVEKLTLRKSDYKIIEDPRVGDHIWWVSNNQKFKSHYPNWKINIGLEEIINEINQSI